MKFTINKQNNRHPFKLLVVLGKFLFIFLYSQILNSFLYILILVLVIVFNLCVLIFSIRLSLEKKIGIKELFYNIN